MALAGDLGRLGVQVRELAFKHCETLVETLLGSSGAPSLLSYPSLAVSLTLALTLAHAHALTLALTLALALTPTLTLTRRALALLADDVPPRRGGPPALAE